MIDQLNQNPLVAIVLILVPSIAVVWKIFHSLYVKPRDFTITGLKDDLSKLQDELVRLRRDYDHVPAQVAHQEPPDNKKTTPTVSANISATEPRRSSLESLRICYEMWSDKDLTDLQKQRFEKAHMGERVSWPVQVESVSDAKHGMILASVLEPSGSWNDSRAIAFFKLSDQEALATLKKGDWILLKATITKFFLGPQVSECTFTKIAQPAH